MAVGPFLVVIGCSVLGHAVGQSATDATNLKTLLFTTNAYDPQIRPVQDQSLPIYIYAEFILLSINNVDERDETIKTTGYLYLTWKDEFLSWTPSAYGNLGNYFYLQDNVWKPDIALKNSYNEYKQLGDKSLNVQVGSNGEVNWYPFQVFVSTCTIDITYFPYDTQTCSLEFTAWSYTKAEVDMEGGSRGIFLDGYEGNSAWDVVDTSWYSKEDSDSSIVFVLKIKRKPLYSLLTLVFPIIMLAILNLFTFVLPSDGGEKAGYAVTVFLAFAVFLTIMEASFPQNSESVAYFAIYVVIQTVQSTMITLIALVMIRCAAFDETTTIPRLLLVFVRVVKCEALRKRLNTKKSGNKVDANGSEIKIRLEDVSDKHQEPDTKSGDIDDDSNENIYTWKYVINTLDIVFFLFFFVIFIISTLMCLLMAQYGG